MALLLSACSGDDSEQFQIRLAELSSENTRLSSELATLTSVFEEQRNAQQGFITQQVVWQPVKYAGGGDTLQSVLDRKVLRCGGNADLPGFGYLDPDSSEFVGFDIDICRAIAASVLGEQGASQVHIIPLTSKLRFASLQSGEVDVLSRNTTWTLSRDVESRGNYGGVVFYDGQGMLVRKADEIRKLSDLQGKSICVQSASTSAVNVEDYFASVGIPIEIRDFEDRITALRQYADESCDAYTGDKSSLLAQRTLLPRPDEHTLLIEEISREPLGPVVRHEDDNWLDIVNWTFQCLLNGELYDLSRENIDSRLNADRETVERQLGITSKLGQMMGLANDFCYQVIKQVGNYSDIYTRHLGPDTLFDLPRGQNALYSDGGLHYPLPMK